MVPDRHTNAPRDPRRTKPISGRTERDGPLIGYSEFRTDLPGGQYPNFCTMRAYTSRIDGSHRYELGPDLISEPHTWTQFAGWSPDGLQAIALRGWESPENAERERRDQRFYHQEGWLLDCYLVEPSSGRCANLTAVDRVSNYNSGLFFWPGDPDRLGFQALIDGISHPFSMDLDGRNKKDLSQVSTGFAYGFSASPDGGRIAYHQNYQIYVAEADGSNPIHVNTGNPFNFMPQWSPEGKWLAFLSGEHYDCHPYLADREGADVRQLAGRQGYRGVVETLDTYDFHSESSDVPVWSPDGRWIYYTAQAGMSVELMRVSPEGHCEQLTHSVLHVLNYHPRFSPDGQWLAFGSNRSGARQLYACAIRDGAVGTATAITDVAPGHACMWPHWQPSGSIDSM